jgi:aminoglycoside/choline kinase family phosphotransferase
MNVDRESFVKTFHLAGLQRNMQALGAFSFLSMQKGKTEFVQHIPAGLSHLREALCMFPEFPALMEMAEKAAALVKERNLLHHDK